MTSASVWRVSAHCCPLSHYNTSECGRDLCFREKHTHTVNTHTHTIRSTSSGGTRCVHVHTGFLTVCVVATAGSLYCLVKETDVVRWCSVCKCSCRTETRMILLYISQARDPHACWRDGGMTFTWILFYS